MHDRLRKFAEKLNIQPLIDCQIGILLVAEAEGPLDPLPARDILPGGTRPLGGFGKTLGHVLAKPG